MLKGSAVFNTEMVCVACCVIGDFRGHCILDVDLRILSACIDYWAFFLAPEHGAIGALLSV